MDTLTATDEAGLFNVVIIEIFSKFLTLPVIRVFTNNNDTASQWLVHYKKIGGLKTKYTLEMLYRSASS